MGKKNPVIVKARQEGYTEGFKIGFEQGTTSGRNTAAQILAARFSELDKVPGIGPKLHDKIVKHFGQEYFQEVPDELRKVVRDAKGS
ncbi:hypothetical protein ACUIJN_22805 [Metabacillus halosaccharovorans]|uniref:hypothetical protein n=1 Tax=Metabacillus halosaccharovorans TaxID=930124 RepID=UPI00403D96DE